MEAESTSIVAYVFLGIGAIVFLVLLFNSFYIVKEQTNAVIQRLGKFNKISLPGLGMKIPVIDQIAGVVNLKVQQLNVEVETKTEDNVFVKMEIPVQCKVKIDKVKEAFYRLDNPAVQIESFVFDVVRALVPAIKLDALFLKKDEIALHVKERLDTIMDEFGYDIMKALVTDIDPDAKVKGSMNEINAAQRLRVAATERGEAEKIIQIKQAEAEMESKILNGKGISGQRLAIIDGLKKSVEAFQKDIEGVQASDVMNLVVLTQYFDTLKEIGMNSAANTILIPHSPSVVGDMAAQLRDSMMIGNLATQKK